MRIKLCNSYCDMRGGTRDVYADVEKIGEDEETPKPI